MNARKRELYKQNEQYKTHARRWYQRNKSYFVEYRSNPTNRKRERGNEKIRRARESPEQRSERLMKQKQHNQKRREASRLYRQRTKERSAQTRKEWLRNNPNARTEWEMRRRARKQGVPYEDVDRAAIIKRDQSTCYLCGKKLDQREIHLDHVIPLSRNGPHTAANLRVACAPCNYAKARHTLDEYLALRANAAH